MPKITISYRRSDTQAIVGRIVDRLVPHYGTDEVFRDIDKIPAGVDFRTHIDNILSETDILLVVVGPQWRGPRAQGEMRIFEEADPVRVEVQTALARTIRIIPVLIAPATMPQESELPPSLQKFCFLNAVTIDPGLDFDHHITRLINVTNEILGLPRIESDGGKSVVLKESGPIIVKYLVVPVLLLALLHYQFIYEFNFAVDRLHFAAVLIVLLFGFSLTWFDRRGYGVAALLSIGTGVLSVAVMQLTGNLIDGAPFIPASAADWRDALKTTALIVLAMVAGSLIARGVSVVRLRKHPRAG